MELQVYQIDGSETGRTIALDASVFGIEPNDHVLWLDVRRTQANGRQGTHKTKERGEIAGSTRKLYRQKGTGMARAGSIKSPIRRSGGRVFGPRPRNYGLRLTKKTRQLARRSALSYKAQSDAIRVVEALAFDEPDTAQLVDMIDALELTGQKVLVLTAKNDAAVYRSSRNLARVHVQEARSASAEELLGAAVIVFEEGAVDVLTETLSGSASARASQAEPEAETAVTDAPSAEAAEEAVAATAAVVEEAEAVVEEAVAVAEEAEDIAEAAEEAVAEADAATEEVEAEAVVEEAEAEAAPEAAVEEAEEVAEEAEAEAVAEAEEAVAEAEEAAEEAVAEAEAAPEAAVEEAEEVAEEAEAVAEEAEAKAVAEAEEAEAEAATEEAVEEAEETAEEVEAAAEDTMAEADDTAEAAADDAAADEETDPEQDKE